jgi:(E)-4-hydroxy-3-methylbut-2-enyl-diphosphate synthase
VVGQQSHKLSNEKMVEHIVSQVETRAAQLELETAAAEVSAG